MGSSFGNLFRISTFGESHGGGVGVIVEGCPPRLDLDLEEIQRELDRRRPGQSHITTPRQEADRVEVLSGLLDGTTTLGTPIAMLVRNKDQRPGDCYALLLSARQFLDHPHPAIPYTELLKQSPGLLPCRPRHHSLVP